MRRLLIYSAAMNLTFFLALFFATALPAATVEVVNEDFESYKVEDSLKGDWEVIGQAPVQPSFYIANFPIHGGEKSLRVAYPTGTNETMGISFEPMRKVTATCYTYPTSDKQTTFRAIVGGAISPDLDDPDAPVGPDDYIGAFITFADDGTVKYQSADGWVATGANYIRRNWNKVEIEVNLDTQNFKVSLNDVVIVPGAPLWHRLDELNVFAISRSPQAEGGESFYVDDIVCTGSTFAVEPESKLTATWGQVKAFH